MNRPFYAHPMNLWERDDGAMAQPKQDEKPWTDEIVAEVRSAREHLFASCDYDLEKLADCLRNEATARGRPVVTYPNRAPSKEAV